jgi:hypothetical protein
MTEDDLERLQNEVDPSYIYGAIAMVFALICFVLPFRTLLDLITSSEEATEDRKYKTICHAFSSCYDRENPLTK